MNDTFEEPRIFQPGDTFRNQHFLIEHFLRAGASGQVYAVRHRFTGERCALKVGHLNDRKNAKKVARSLIEAQATHGLRHPNVVRVFNLACEDDGMVWQAMELLEGQPVGALLGRGARFSPLYALDVALEVAWGLQAAHEQQIIHRDIQPFNVFITSAGSVKVLDFSLAKVIPSGLQTTHGSRAVGTMGYMAPGIDMLSLVKKHLGEELPPLVGAAGLPSYCDELIRKATAKDPSQRYAGMWPFAQGMVALRERLLADPGAELVRLYSSREQQCRIKAHAEGHARSGAMAPLPANPTAPPLPSQRLVVAPAVAPPVVTTAPAPGPEARRVVAKTVPMAAVGAAMAEGPMAAGEKGERRSAPTLMMTPPVVPAGMSASGVDVGAPTMRGDAQRRKGGWAALVAVLVAVGLLVGGVVWVLQTSLR